MRGVVSTACWVAAVCAVVGYVAGWAANSRPPGIAIDLVATRFEFSRPEIRVRKGERVTLVLSSPDFPHGFGLPDFGVRADLIPGRTVQVTFTPDRAGRFIYLCDNFCGEGHDRMSGTLVVTD